LTSTVDSDSSSADEEITREDKDILESTDPDAVVDLRRRGVEYSMDSDRPGILIRRKLMTMLSEAGEAATWPDMPHQTVWNPHMNESPT
ncbi:MAG: hypothetical protein Q8K34_08090, partial [Hydrogenophaga sp.]|nr:hypothetical protein [Hydrogenophaga sp.]